MGEGERATDSVESEVASVSACESVADLIARVKVGAGGGIDDVADLDCGVVNCLRAEAGELRRLVVQIADADGDILAGAVVSVKGADAYLVSVVVVLVCGGFVVGVGFEAELAGVGVKIEG